VSMWCACQRACPFHGWAWLQGPKLVSACGQPGNVCVYVCLQHAWCTVHISLCLLQFGCVALAGCHVCSAKHVLQGQGWPREPCRHHVSPAARVDDVCDLLVSL
jgi:hypothetical protein